MKRYHARWVLPISAPPIEHATVVVENDRIAYVGPRGDAPPGQDGKDRDLGDAILLPGLVNAHCHLELTALRGFLEDLGFAQWIMRLNAVKRAVLDRESLLDSARFGLVEGIRHGITTYADTCDSGVAFDAMLEAGVRGIMYQEVFGPDPSACGRSLGELRGKIDQLRLRQSPLVRVGVSPHAPYTVSDALYAAVAELAEQESLPVAVHIAESEVEKDLVERGAGIFADGLRKRGIPVAARARSSMDLLRKTGVLKTRPLLIHSVRLDAEDIGLVAGSGSPVAHCPVSNAKLGHGVAPILELIDAGVTIALGSDSVASNNRMDMFAEGRAAVLGQRSRVARHDALCARDALWLATMGGARALGLETEIGSLDVGKSADIAAFPIDGHARPVHDIEAAAIFALPGTAAALVMVAGHELVTDGAPTRVDPTLDARITAIERRMRQWAVSTPAE